MIKKIFIGSLLLFSTYICVAGEAIELYLGEIKILDVGDITRIAVGNSKLISTSMLNNGQLLLIAEGEGDSNVHLWFNNGTEQDIFVHINKVYGLLNRKADEVKSLLEDVNGLSVRVVGERIILSGLIDNVHTPAIDTIKAAFPEVMDLSQKGAVQDMSLPDNKMVIMNIKITEFNKNYLETLGINWASSITGPAAAFGLDLTTRKFANGTQFAVPSTSDTFKDLLPTSSALGYFGIATEITSRINFAVNSGNALILAEPRLATRSGGEANFLAGGEFPIEISTINGTTIEFKEFGIALSIAPVVDRENNIRAHISTEISAIDRSVSVGDVPGLLTRKTSTDVSMRSGETLVMSGLINQQASKDISRLKFLGDIPILGALFRSKTFRDQKSELVIFVTPTVFDANSDLNKEAIEYSKAGIQSAIEAIGEKSLEIID